MSIRGNRQLRRSLFCLLFFLPTATATAAAENPATGPPDWRLLSLDQVNPPGLQAFLETFFSHNQLKADPGGDLLLGFAAIRDANRGKDTDVFVSRFDRSEDRWNPPVPIAETPNLERSPEIWIDGRSGAIHAAWAGNPRQKPGGPRSELRIGYRRSENGGATWTPPRDFPVGTALARRPQLMGDGQGRLYLVNSNGYPGGQERIHLFQSADGGENWRPVDVNFPEAEKRGDTRSLWLAIGPDNRAHLAWADPTVGRRAIVYSRTTGEFTWSPPVRVNDDSSMSCQEPRLAVRGNSVYVAWRVVKGDRTTLYFDHSDDGGATWNEDQVIFDRPALSVRASLQPFDGGPARRLVRVADAPGPGRPEAALSPVCAGARLDGPGRGEGLPGGGPRARPVLLRLRPAALAGGMPGGLFQGGHGSLARNFSGLERRPGIRILGVVENQ